MPKLDPRLQKWLRWLEVIKLQVQDLVMAKHTFHEVQAIIRDNPALHQANSFYKYLTITYVSHVVMGVRRQVKCDTQSISFAQLLGEMVATPELLSRPYYISLYAGTTVEDLADGDFDRFAPAGAKHIDPILVEADLQRLREATAKCEEFADRRLAHHDKRDPKQLPTYNELDVAIDLLDQLYCRYFLLFHASAMDTLLPTWQYDWKEIFHTPWLPPP
ncbi:MAG: hypothetical protein Q8R06_17120 [Polaromonas sp.]|uniref:hypothetical protein n=1 Tax=Polaromonas sp. TaxID=1869339 RepID=UPI002734487C|nr:hypothetical protein [Polaromonas sp.]MDP3798839.1 hypothetical protein [Polaromonas sp.]